MHLEEGKSLSAYLEQGQKKLGPVQIVMSGPLQVLSSPAEAVSDPFDFSKVSPESCIHVVIQPAAPQIGKCLLDPLGSSTPSFFTGVVHCAC